ncbi:DUF3124 domain-containing protein [Leptolyngbya iicbica]|uniref:DUF3124 domain-containing protein n=2 Tax=Cyanophyceae TaxID=3028117 RepID=A0A4Q7EAC1_9CYAN|nr:DUF3124 domain-containing protein [Leptolyngbya sp. LK]RZM79419.1 DUF3124 domain-containing protein [Leptolyngbya sp. LK]
MKQGLAILRSVSRGLGLASVLGLGILMSTACESSVPASLPPAPELQPVVLDDTVEIAVGQTLYVPVYSYIFMVNEERTINLTTTLSIRNTSRTEPMILTAVDYHDSQGTLVRNYLENPVELGPLMATEFVIRQEDVTGGIGAAFLVDWVAHAEISEPVIEAVMINTQGNQGLSFVSIGRVIETRP